MRKSVEYVCADPMLFHVHYPIDTTHVSEHKDYNPYDKRDGNLSTLDTKSY